MTDDEKQPNDSPDADSAPQADESGGDYRRLESQIREQFAAQAEKISALESALHKGIGEIDEQLRGVRDFVAGKEKELQRWREGYDLSKHKAVLGEVADFLDYLEERENYRAKSGEEKAWYADVGQLAELLLEKFDSERIRPKVGDAFDDWRGRAESTEAKETQRQEDDGKICEVTRSGVLHKRDDADDGIPWRKARVKVWRFSPQTENAKAPDSDKTEKK